MSFAMSELIWLGIIVPCGSAALVMVVCRWMLLPARGAWAKSVGAGFVVGAVGLSVRNAGWRTGLGSFLAPGEAGDWLPWLVMAAVGITFLAAHAPRNWQRWIVALAIVLAIAMPVRLLAGNVANQLSAWEKLGVILGWAVALTITWALLAAGRANGQPRVRGGLLALVAIGMAAGLTLAGSIKLGELCVVVAAAIVGALVARVLKHGSPAEGDDGDLGLSGAAGVLSMALGGLVLLGYFYAELSAASAALLLASLVAAGGRLPATWPRGPMGQIAFRAMLCIVPLALALALAFSTMIAERGAGGY